MSQNLNLIDRFLIYHILNSTAECRLYLDLYDKTYNYIESRDYKNIRKKWEVLE